MLDPGDIDAYTRDAQKITLRMTITTQAPDAAVYHLLYEVGRAGNVDLERNYTTEIAGADRQQILDETEGVLKHDLADLFGIKVDSVQTALTGMPPSYATAIEAAMQART